MVNLVSRKPTPVDLQALGALLDQAEDIAENTEYFVGDFDRLDEQGNFIHERESCPACRFADAKNAYFTACRDELFRNKAKLEKMASNPADDKLLERVAAAWRAARDYFESLPESGISRRARIDAEVAEERASMLFETISDRWALRMEEQKQERRRALRKRRK